MTWYLAGRDGEKLVGSILEHDGWRIIDVNQNAGDGAPLLRGLGDDLRLPDILAVKDGQWVFVEVKTKKDGPEYIVKLNDYQNCIDKIAFEDYRAIQSETGTPVFICIYEDSREAGPTDEKNILYQHLGQLTPSETLGTGNEEIYGREQVFLSRRQFEQIESCWFEGDAYVGGSPLGVRTPTPILDLVSLLPLSWGSIASGNPLQTDLSGNLVGDSP